jgi:hypothetical protein
VGSIAQCLGHLFGATGTDPVDHCDPFAECRQRFPGVEAQLDGITSRGTVGEVLRIAHASGSFGRTRKTIRQYKQRARPLGWQPGGEKKPDEELAVRVGQSLFWGKGKGDAGEREKGEGKRGRRSESSELCDS